MSPATTTLRRILAPLTATILVALSVVVPMLDAGLQSRDPVLESSHDAHCVVGHDHTICSQANASRALPASGSRAPAPMSTAPAHLVRPVDRPLPRTPSDGRNSRAPPLARA